MPAIITLAHQKGGVGKTTLTLNLYNFFTKQGVTCAILDEDPQGSIIRLYEEMGGVSTSPETEDKENARNSWADLDVLSSSQLSSYEDLTQLENYQVILVDTPPYLSDNLPDIFKVSDLVIVPCRPSILDASAIGATVGMIREAQAMHPNLKGAIVLTMTISGTKFNDVIREHLKQHEMHTFNTDIAQRLAYARSLAFSPSVDAENNDKANNEIEALGNEILSYLQD